MPSGPRRPISTAAIAPLPQHRSANAAEMRQALLGIRDQALMAPVTAWP